MAIGNGQEEFGNGTQPEGSRDIQDDVKCDRSKPVVHGHPALLRWTPPRKHNLSPTQFESLELIADTFVPSLPPPFTDGEGFELMRGVTTEDVARFYKLKASDEDIIGVMAAILGVLMRPPVLKSVLAVLQFLGTGWGTTLLAWGGGVNTASLKYPFFRKFANLTPEEREKMLQGWSTSPLSLLQQLFKSLKSLTGYTLYSKINDDGENPAWKAIGYIGMDPTVRSRSKEEYSKPRPLEDGHVDAKKAGTHLKAILMAKGFTVHDEIKSFREQSRKWGYSESSSDIYFECDVVIVGSGSGGGVMAAVLAKQGFKVLVLEKGQYFAAQDITSLEGPGMVNMYEKMGAQSTDDGGVSLIAGKTVGGGTAVNWCVSFKTPEHVRNEWVTDHGLDLFSSARYEQAMQAVWKRLAVQPEVDKHSLQNTVLQEGCQKLGYECGTLERNCNAGHYCGWCSYGCPTGKKQSTAETWLVDAVKTGNAVILSNCDAEYIFHDANPGGKKARKGHGVVATIGEGSTRIFVKANATVISCGALQTPPLLLRSGLKNPNIGKYLRVHPATTCFGYFPEGVGPEGKSYEGGIMTTYSPVILRKPTEYGGLLETGVFHPAVFAAFHPWQSGADGKERLLRHGRTSHITVVTRDKGFGTARIDNEGLPIYNYKMSAYDEQTLMAGMIQSLRILVAAGAVEVGTQQLDGERFKVKGATPAQIEEYFDRVQRRRARQSSIQIASAHQLGSCRMGTTPRTSAVDPRGEIWEVEGVFVADGSVLPTSSGVNPMVTIQSIAYCTADSVTHFLHGASGKSCQ